MTGVQTCALPIFYLIRWAGCPEASITATSIADFFNMTENDVKRALRFWEQEGLLRIAWDEDGNITAICLRPVTAPYDREPAAAPTRPAAPSPSIVQETTGYRVPAYSVDDLQTFMEEQSGDQLFFIIQQYTDRKSVV